MAKRTTSRKSAHKARFVKEIDLFKEHGLRRRAARSELSSRRRVALKMPSDVGYLDDVLDYLRAAMLKHGIIRPGDSEVVVALEEAIVNAIKHGNKNDSRKAVHIIAEMTAEGAHFTVSDEGRGFACCEVPDPTHPSRLLEPGGRGLLLIRHIMDEVTHNECGNEIKMFKRSCARSKSRPLRNPNRR